MYLIIVGAGLIGNKLIKLALEDKNEVVVIEKNKEIAREIDSKFDCLVINGDATERDILEEAGIDKADALITTTEKEVINLVICLFSNEYEVNNIVSVAHDPKNTKLFKEIGVNTVENPQDVIARDLYSSLKRPAVIDFMKVGENAEVFEIRVKEEASITRVPLQEAAEKNLIPEKTIIVAISRENKTIIPKGETKLKPNDVVTILSIGGQNEEFINSFSK